VDKAYDDYNQFEFSEEDNAAASLSTIGELGTLFWLITLLCLTLYGAVLPFNYIASGFLTETYFKNMSKVEAQNNAGIYMSIPFFISAFVVPLYGIIIDKYGQRAYLSLFASICGFICFIMLYIFPPILGLIILGLTYSMFASVIWPAISLVVKKSQVGFAYGVTTSIQNAGLAIFPIFVADIYSKSKSYYATLIFFLILMIISIILSLLLINKNNEYGSKLKFIFRYNKQNIF
jgi:MFS family permease